MRWSWTRRCACTLPANCPAARPPPVESAAYFAASELLANVVVAKLSPRERAVLGLMAEGRSNAAIAQRLVITERAVAKHTASIFVRLGLQPSDDDNRRVLAVLAFLGR
jgi:DNA-binding NarL/FixJ family response regulator